MPPITRNKAPTPSAPSSDPATGTRATRSTSTKPPSGGSTVKPAGPKSQLSKSTSTLTSSAPPPKPAASLGRSTSNRMSVVLPKRSTISTNTTNTGDKTALSNHKDKDKESDDKEPIRAFLRIRPTPNTSVSSTPYIHTLSETAVEMTDPSPTASRFGMRPSLAPAPSTTYTFTRVFSPDTLQPEFFASTALPLVKDLLNGENGLAFAYGVTNSGKTWTIQGGSGKGEGGLLPRTLDVLFNSIEGLHADNRWRPAKCSSVEREPNYGPATKAKGEPAIEPDVEALLDSTDSDKDDTSVKVDRNYEYSVFVSYAEVYNEKIFDLLATSSLSSEDASVSAAVSRSNSTQSISRLAQQPTGTSQAKPLPRYLSALLPKSISSHLGFSSSVSSTNVNTGAAWGAGDVPGTLSRKALALKSDPMTGGKFVSGLREIRVRTAEEGKAILRLGQINRTVFGTVANERSSRSHAVFTIKVLKVHKGASKDDPEEVQCARLSVVDLAGSERSKNTQTTGDRLKEAGNINKSLMVLGQCMEMLRANQRKIAMGMTLKLGVVPFRHSKLTELFQDFFVGEGRAVMIVNVNPYDTGFDENSHVMRFSALARDVATTTTRAVTRAPPAAKSSGSATAARASSVKALVAAAENRSSTSATTADSLRKSLTPVRTARKVRLSEGTPAETVLEVVEEDEGYDEDEDEVPHDTLVDELFEEVEWLREKLFEAEMRAGMIEAEVREEVTREMEERMQVMEKMFTRRLASEVEAGEIKTDRKIDMLQRTGLIQARQEDDTDEEEHIDKSLFVESDEDEEDEEEEEEGESVLASPTPKQKQGLTGGPLAPVTEGQSFEEGSSAQEDDEDEEDEEEEEDTTMEMEATLEGDITGEVSMSIDQASESEEEEDEEESESEDQAPTRKPRTPSKSAQKQRVTSDDDEWHAEDDEEEEDYQPSPPVRVKRESIARTPKPAASSSKTRIPSPVKSTRVKQESPSPFKVKEETIDVDVDEEDEEDESLSAAAIVPNKRVRAARLSASGPGSVYIPSPGEPDTVKKKKRQLGKGAALTEDQIWQVEMKAEEQERKASTVRRLGRGSR